MFLDVGIGLLLAMATGWLTNTNHKLWLLIFGAVSSLAPDIDLMIYLIKHKGKLDQFAHEHHELLHKPLFFSFGVAFVILWLDVAYIDMLYQVQLSLWASIWFSATIAHFIHDTFEGGWGIQWLWPFRDEYYLLAKNRLQVIHDKHEQREIAIQYGNPDWLKNYFNLEWWTITKIIFFVVALITSFWYTV
ncbi:MAG: hypothetical protein COY09_00425 [Candidatus Portnoybacteria bacterium CG_4_10_14_0_2_um_filter_39_11]|uniref:Metal-dependent hydrolase n=1 Tax=Candidatus Portnoybacteria bacterium CG_4_10_14_0_2_um_filter_39_11 TaxID=1974797 RepID=A0A2M7UK56_9BACT|nr:MAG: hypothetical protein AUJ33_00960 [Parcubacteria group bacterium CG1_02_40_25]PIZ71608.1 MAG: hypothetical protein COY09_00425 [Candidatus Portnoybacteria bacterium CG_4_10_14_0_2_um_filter_39_11]